MPKQIDDSQILKATVDVLLAHGYVGATTKQIAEEAGVNEVTLFRKFGTKAQLVYAALMHERQAFTERPIAYSGDLRADLLQMARLYSEASPRQSRLMLLILAEAARQPELRDAVQVPYMLIARFADIVARYQAEGRLRQEDPLLVIGALLGPLVINTMLRLTESDLPIPPVALEAHVDNFLRGYAP